MDTADMAAVRPSGEFKDRNKAIGRARSSRDLGLSWITSKIGNSGKPQCDPAATYRLPWALAVSGRREEAAAVLAWASREILTADGDMAPGSLRTKFTSMAASYPLAILAVGAWHLDRYDLANKIMDALVGYQNQGSGGAYSQTPEARGSQPFEDLYPTAQLGLAGLCTGRLSVAAGAYRWITNLWDAQPDLPGRLFTRMSRGQLVTDAADDAMSRFHMVTDLGGARQAFYNPGIAAAFLGRYYLATGDHEALVAASRFLSLSAAGGPEQFNYQESRQICKFGWGSAVLTEADPGNASYESYTLRMTQWFVESQEADGRWHNSPFLDPGPTEAGDMAVTTEFVLHLSTILAALSGKAAAEFKAAA
jgi:hypothetical protein